VTELVLSLFPGIDLLGRAFRDRGFCVVTGPDLVVGDDVREFVTVPGRFDGIIGGPPCQDFSRARRAESIYDGYGVSMLQCFLRIVENCQPNWFLIENVPSVPDVTVRGYSVQRLDITDLECGGVQRRLRHIQFASRAGEIIRPARLPVTDLAVVPAVTGQADISFVEACRRQGVTRRLRLPGWRRDARQQAIGNAVSMHVGRTLADAVTARSKVTECDCTCLCGRAVTGRQFCATAACRKRMERRRRGWLPLVSSTSVTQPGDFENVTRPADFV